VRFFLATEPINSPWIAVMGGDATSHHWHACLRLGQILCLEQCLSQRSVASAKRSAIRLSPSAICFADPVEMALADHFLGHIDCIRRWNYTKYVNIRKKNRKFGLTSQMSYI
jgi:hypothetical protein